MAINPLDNRRVLLQDLLAKQADNSGLGTRRPNVLNENNEVITPVRPNFSGQPEIQSQVQDALFNGQVPLFTDNPALLEDGVIPPDQKAILYQTQEADYQKAQMQVRNTTSLPDLLSKDIDLDALSEANPDEILKAQSELESLILEHKNAGEMVANLKQQELLRKHNIRELFWLANQPHATDATKLKYNQALKSLQFDGNLFTMGTNADGTLNEYGKHQQAIKDLQEKITASKSKFDKAKTESGLRINQQVAQEGQKKNLETLKRLNVQRNKIENEEQEKIVIGMLGGDKQYQKDIEDDAGVDSMTITLANKFYNQGYVPTSQEFRTSQLASTDPKILDEQLLAIENYHLNNIINNSKLSTIKPDSANIIAKQSFNENLSVNQSVDEIYNKARTGQLIKPKRVIDKDYHKTFPRLFQDDGSLMPNIDSNDASTIIGNYEAQQERVNRNKNFKVRTLEFIAKDFTNFAPDSGYDDFESFIINKAFGNLSDQDGDVVGTVGLSIKNLKGATELMKADRNLSFRDAYVQSLEFNVDEYLSKIIKEQGFFTNLSVVNLMAEQVGLGFRGSQLSNYPTTDRSSGRTKEVVRRMKESIMLNQIKILKNRVIPAVVDLYAEPLKKQSGIIITDDDIFQYLVPDSIGNIILKTNPQLDL